MVPKEINDDLKRATRLEWWTLGWMASVVAVMGLAMGTSQAMKTAFIEDVLSLIPAIVFIIAAHFERKRPTRLFPYGFARVNSLAFLIAATALTAVGAHLLFEAIMTLIAQDHASVPPVNLFGATIWSGWVMVAALLYSVVPPMILGRMKLPLARRLQDKVLHTDAMMQRADWMTGLAGVAGVVGLGFGLWWADSAAAGLIAVSILKDGITALRSATAELNDGAPRALENDEIHDEAKRLQKALKDRYPGCGIRLRETGRYINAQVVGAAPDAEPDLAALWPGEPERAWRFGELSFVPAPQKQKRGKDG